MRILRRPASATMLVPSLLVGCLTPPEPINTIQPMTESPLQRIAGIDLGSNSLKLAIGAVSTDQLPQITIKHRIPLRLATDAFDGGRFRGETIDQLIEASRRFSEILERVRIEAYRAVATEAFRRVENAGEAIDRIREASGLVVEVLTPEAEIRLVLDAIRTRMIDGRNPDLLVDLMDLMVQMVQ